MTYLFLILGLITLILGGDLLVRGATTIALRAKISPLVIGMTVVSFGTSAPELLVSLKSVLNGHPDVATGGIIGSNISNIGLVLGITLLIFPIKVNRDSLIIDWPMMLLSTLLFFFLAKDGSINRIEGIAFVLILISFLFWLIYRSRKKGKKLASEMELEEIAPSKKSLVFKDISFIILGILGLYFGAEWLINSVVDISKNFGISEKLVSITVVAFGTSVPELTTSVVAAFKKQTDISIGNLIGSNIFNILAILGITGIIHPIAISDSINQFDNYFLLGITLILFPLMFFGKKITYRSGLVLISIYVFYIYFSIIAEI